MPGESRLCSFSAHFCSCCTYACVESGLFGYVKSRRQVQWNPLATEILLNHTFRWLTATFVSSMATRGVCAVLITSVQQFVTNNIISDAMNNIKYAYV